MCKSMDEIVYHYCSVDTFFNIIRNSSMWLSDIAKSNDYQECIRCREFVNKGMEEYLRNDVEALKAWKTWYENGVYSNFSMKTFCVCFSESKDKLSQWRGYAQDGKGIAIGFNKDVLEELYWSSFLVTLCSEIMLYIETPLVSYSYSLNEVSHSCTS